jgi:hypothetical protein
MLTILVLAIKPLCLQVLLALHFSILPPKITSNALDIVWVFQVPYLVDPNTGFQSGDHKKILSYLFQQYSISS